MTKGTASDRNETVAWGLHVQGGFAVKWQERASWSDGNVVHLNWSGGYRDVVICQNVSNCTLGGADVREMESGSHAAPHWTCRLGRSRHLSKSPFLSVRHRL